MLEIQADLDDALIQRHVFIESARTEMLSMIKNYNALTISRLGFVAQEMKGIENEVSIDISNRALQINSTTAECIVDAKRSLGYAANYAGLAIVEVTREIAANLNTVNNETVYPLLYILENSTHELELLTVYAYFNTVKDYEYAYFRFSSKVRNHVIDFDLYVRYILKDMVLWNKLITEFNGDMYQILESGTDYFRFLAYLIKNSLVDCNS